MSKVDEVLAWYDSLTPEERCEVESSVVETINHILNEKENN